MDPRGARAGWRAGGLVALWLAPAPGCGDKEEPVDSACEASSWYLDGDGDGFGDETSEVLACEAPSDHVAPRSGYLDCDDSDAAVHPLAQEVCNGVDDDCDGLVDSEDPSHDGGTDGEWHVDADGDGHGAAGSEATSACLPGAGWAATATDCDDSDAAVNPGAVEVCNGIDDDCDDLVDDGDPSLDLGTAEAWYPDGDGDGYGDDAGRTEACEDPGGAVAQGGDCDDADPAVSPGAAEVCSGRDDDCDGLVDMDDEDLDPSSVRTFYRDADGDGHGDPAASEAACEAPAGYVDSATDCDDTEPLAWSTADETCGDGVDNDCNGLADCEDGWCDSVCSESDCDDGVDNEGDGLVDCRDDECWGEAACVPAVQRARVSSGSGRVAYYQRTWREDSASGAASWGERGWRATFSGVGGSATVNTSQGGSSVCTFSVGRVSVVDAALYQYAPAYSWSRNRGPTRSSVAMSGGCPVSSTAWLPTDLRLYSGSGVVWWPTTGWTHTSVAAWGPPWYLGRSVTTSTRQESFSSATSAGGWRRGRSSTTTWTFHSLGTGWSWSP